MSPQHHRGILLCLCTVQQQSCQGDQAGVAHQLALLRRVDHELSDGQRVLPVQVCHMRCILPGQCTTQRCHVVLVQNLRDSLQSLFCLHAQLRAPVEKVEFCHFICPPARPRVGDPVIKALSQLREELLNQYIVQVLQVPNIPRCGPAYCTCTLEVCTASLVNAPHLLLTPAFQNDTVSNPCQV